MAPPTPRPYSDRKAEHKRYNDSPRGAYRHLTSTAKKRELPCHITLEEFTKMHAFRVCYYCDGPVGSAGHGLDRLDNKKGYTLENVVRCCGTCNTFRSNQLSVAETMFLIRALKDYRSGRS